MTRFTSWTSALQGRLSDLTAPPAGPNAGSTALWNLLDDSVVGRLVARVTAPFGRAYEESQTVSLVRAIVVMSPPTRMRSVGVVAVVSAAVHIALMWSRSTAGWWWILIPAVVLASGIFVTLLTFTTKQK